MRRGQLVGLLDEERITHAIQEAERLSSGEIRVSISTFFWGDVRHTAERAFDRLGMSATRERNGVLFFVVPTRHRFVVLGDEGIHAKVGQQFWDQIAAAMSEKFHARDFTGGLVLGIGEAGRQLAIHFPSHGPRDVNELSNEIDYGEHPRPP